MSRASEAGSMGWTYEHVIRDWTAAWIEAKVRGQGIGLGATAH